MNFQIVFLILGLAALFVTLFSLRRENIRTEYSVSWLAVGAILTILSLSPRTIDVGSRTLGLDPQVFFVIVAGSLISGLLFEISHLVSRLRDENVMLAQRVAILEFRLERTNEQDSVKNA
jgi:hypothetical protein